MARRRQYTDGFRREAIARVEAGEEPEAVAEAMDVPVGTVKSWVHRYGGQEDAPQPQRSQGPQEAEEPPEAPPVHRPPRVTATTPQDAAAVPYRLRPPRDIADASRVEYLRDRVAWVEEQLRELLADDKPSWGSVKPLAELQSKLHEELSGIIRAEGSRLDLTTSPLQLAAAVDGLSRLLSVLGADLDHPDTLDLAGLEDIMGEVEEDDEMLGGGL